MTEAERRMALKAGLTLVLLEGWVHPASVTARLGADASAALRWLRRAGYAVRGEGGVLRWEFARPFEALWAELVPERACPVRLCDPPRVSQRRQLHL